MVETCPPQQPVQGTIRHERMPRPETVVVKECTGCDFCVAQTLLALATVETTAAYESGAVEKYVVFRSRAWDGNAPDRHVLWHACSCCTDPITACSLSLLQEVREISKTRNQFSGLPWTVDSALSISVEGNRHSFWS